MSLDTLRHIIREQLDLDDPMHNVREIVKQLILLEDHLNCADKRCMDCIKKHLLAAEALAEEAVSLAACRPCSAPIEGLSDILRRIYADVTSMQGCDLTGVSDTVRTVRKQLQSRV